ESGWDMDSPGVRWGAVFANYSMEGMRQGATLADRRADRRTGAGVDRLQTGSARDQACLVICP
ncbi:hypothetical protein ACFWXT_29525, partial [Bacillus cereus]|uniref:hypothetical protein n=1 Tax=Bacillus cereus TaxID=1396 RepID=UPI00366AB609